MLHRAYVNWYIMMFQWLIYWVFKWQASIWVVACSLTHLSDRYPRLLECIIMPVVYIRCIDKIYCGNMHTFRNQSLKEVYWWFSTTIFISLYKKSIQSCCHKRSKQIAKRPIQFLLIGSWRTLGSSAGEREVSNVGKPKWLDFGITGILKSMSHCHCCK